MKLSSSLNRLRVLASQGGKTYFKADVPCRHGHIGERFTKSGACCECSRLRNRQQYLKTREVILEKSAKRWRAANPVAVRPVRDELNRLRQEARANNQKHFAVGLPCKRGHTEGRLVSNGVCLACSRSVVKKWATQNKDRIAAASKRYRRKYPERAKESTKQWVENNRAVIAEYGIKRRRREDSGNLKGIWNSQLNAVYKQAKRLSKWIGIEYHVDHIVPIVHPLVCGLHVPWNLQIIPAWQNIEKSNKFDCG